jgi:hypothetical protein
MFLGGQITNNGFGATTIKPSAERWRDWEDSQVDYEQKKSGCDFLRGGIMIYSKEDTCGQNAS